MGGNWSDNPLPIRAGGYINFESSGSAPVEPGTFGRVGMPIRASWGPANTFVDIITDDQRTATYGNTDGDVTSTTDTSWLIREAIVGGSELVKAYRIVDEGSASASSAILVDAGANTILTVNAKYLGTRANLFRVRVAQNPLFTYRQDLIVEELSGSNWQEIDKHTFDSDDVSRLVTLVNATSAYIELTLDSTAAAPVNEVQRLTATTPVTGGFYRLQFFDGSTSQISADIAHDAPIADVQTALEALTNIGAGNVAVTGTRLNNNSWTLTRDATGVGAGELADVGVSVNGAAAEIYQIDDTTTAVTLKAGIDALPAMIAASATVTVSVLPTPAATMAAASEVWTIEFNNGEGVVTFDNTAAAAPGSWSLGSGADAAVAGPSAPAAAATMDITFQGTLAGMDVFEFTQAAGSASPLVGGPITISTLTTGSPTQNEVQQIDVTTGLAGAETLSLTVDTGTGPLTSVALPTTATAADIQVALASMNNVGVGNVSVSNSAGLTTIGGVSTFTVSFIGTLTGQNIVPIIASIANPIPTGVVVMSTLTEGQPEALVIQTAPLNGGSDGAAANLLSYTNAMTAFEAEGGFDLFAFDGISEENFAGLNSAVKVWADANNEAGRYVMVVMGGGNIELANAGGAGVATALNRSAIFDSEWIVNLGVSGLQILSPAGNQLDSNSAQSSPRLAGMIASSGITGSVTFGEAFGVLNTNGPLTPIQIETLIQEGVTLWSKRGDVVRLEDGITSFTNVTEEKDFTFTQIRAVRAIQQIGIDITEIVETDWIGKVVNTTSVRDSLVARLEQYFTQLEAQRVLVNGTEVQIDTRFDNTKTNVFVLVLAQFQFELKRVLLTVRVPTVS